jgi:hypothetical protein
MEEAMANLKQGSVGRMDLGPMDKGYFDRFRLAQKEEIANVKQEIKLLRAANPKNPLIGKIMRYPAADGYAQYLICSTKPLILQHVKIGDAWLASGMEIRGTRLQDVKMLSTEFDPDY